MPVEAPPAPNVVPAAPTPSAEAVAAKAAQTQINVSSMPTGDQPAAPAKAGSARARFEADFAKRFGGETAEKPAAAPAREPAGKPSSAPPSQSAEQGKPEEGAAPHDPAPSSSTEKPAEAPTKPAGKVSPWKLVDEHKAARTAAEKEALALKNRIAELEKQVTPKEKLDDYEKRIKDMSEDLRYLNAEKYDPDVIKATSEYEGAWKRAMAELNEIPVKDPNTGESRAATVNDLAAIVRMSLGQAREVAEALFGPFADDMMDYRREIKTLWEAKDSKLEELRKNGAQREEQRTQQTKLAEKQMEDYVGQIYTKTIEADLANEKHGQFFRPREGDEAWNKALEDGFKLVDEAMSHNPKAPDLTAEQRVQIIRKHAAVRNMAGSWKALRQELDTTKKALAEAQAKLKEYDDTAPPAAGRAAPPPTERKRGMAGLMDDLTKIAH